MKDTKENRIKFLKENAALMQFIENMDGDANYLDPEAYPENYFILGAFRWIVSPQGHEFWGRLNDKYCSLIEE